MLLLTHNVNCNAPGSKHQQIFIMRVPCHSLEARSHVIYLQHLYSRKAVTPRMNSANLCRQHLLQLQTALLP